MKELRCLVFTDQEVVNAVFDRRRKRAEASPAGMITGVVFQQTQNGVETTVHILDDMGDDRTLKIEETEVAAALVNYCMGRKIPLPVDSDKSLYLINGSATLMITMNFNKAPRMVPLTAGEARHDAQPAAGSDLRAPAKGVARPRRP